MIHMVKSYGKITKKPTNIDFILKSTYYFIYEIYKASLVNMSHSYEKILLEFKDEITLLYKIRHFRKCCQ